MQPVPGMPKPTKTITEHRFYFENQDLIKWLEAGKTVSSTAKNYKERGIEVLSGGKKAYSFASKGD